MESFSSVLVCVLISFQLCQAADWSYTGSKGVDNWAQNYPGQCDGQQQSPINLLASETYFEPTLQVFEFEGFRDTNGVTWELLNNGHTVQVTYTGGNLTVKGGSLGAPYKVAQFHFHWGSDNTKGSEHVVDGSAYPMEVHVVCFRESYGDLGTAVGQKDGLAVLGFFFEISANSNPTIQKLVDKLPEIKYGGNTTSNITPFPLDDLIAGVNDFYRYSGGLTTPTCNEVVTWTVFTSTIKISAAQMGAFRTVLDKSDNPIVDNFRPPQRLFNRRITASFNRDDFASASAGLVFNSLALVASLALSIWLRQ